MNKRRQQIPDIYEAARKCPRTEIRVALNLIFAYTGEEESGRRDTPKITGGIAALYHNVSFSPNILTPYAGISIWPDLHARGVREPESLEASVAACGPEPQPQPGTDPSR